jgi:rubrerythrin
MFKKYSILILSFVLVAGFFSCSQKQNKTAAEQTSSQQTERKTVTDLKAASDGEATASAKYAEYAKKAAKEGLPQIEALFKATSKAEAIHLANHLEALSGLGVKDYKAKVDTFEVKSTAENLKAAIEGETGESTSMYPQYIKDANADFEDEAVTSFTYAEGAEKDHAKLYSEALANLKNPKKLATSYYVCPTCGFVYANEPAEICELCKTPADQFIEFSTAH